MEHRLENQRTPIITTVQPGLTVEAAKLRHSFFAERKMWVLPHPSGQERDGYDARAVHVEAVGPEGMLLGYLRLLLSDGPMMLDTEFALLMKGCEPRKLLRDGSVAEVSRLVILESRSPAEKISILRALFAKLYLECRERGVTVLHAQVESGWLERINRFMPWFTFEELAQATFSENNVTYAIFAEIDVLFCGASRSNEPLIAQYLTS